MNTIILFRKDFTTEEELEIAQRSFDVVEYRNFVPEDSLVIGRYSTLPFYKELEMDLLAKNSRLINSYDQYSWIANFDWYEDLKEFTFKTWFYATELPDDGTQFVVKGRTNSRKHEWDELMFAPNKKRAIEIMIELNKDSLIGPQGVVFRKYEPLVTYEIGLKGLRFTNEWRFFFYKDYLLSYGYYWTMAKNILQKLPEEAIEFAKQVAKVAKNHTNFFVLDVAQKEDGSWILVEVNDGQMSGLSENRPRILYHNLDTAIQSDLYGRSSYFRFLPVNYQFEDEEFK